MCASLKLNTMINIPFVDTHFHLHDLKRPELRYLWLERDWMHPLLGNIDALKSQHYWVQDFIAEIRFSNVPKAIHVQAALGTVDPVDETRWLQGFAREFGYPHAIVAECHLDQPDARSVLERHLEFANVRGIRDFGPGEYLLDSRWRAGFRLLGELNLVSCIDTRPERAAHLLDLAQSHANVQICIDHCALPEKRDAEYFQLWRKAIGTLAQAPNITMKISGLGMCDPRWTLDSLRPWVLACIETFGTSRVVFGSNWPVDRQYSSYPDVINAYRTILAGFSEAEQLAMLSGNAERLFRI
jgi:predicted TIM-barrel fold metal-dependent hydrolase